MEGIPTEQDNPLKKLKVSTGTFPTVDVGQSVGISSSSSVHVAKEPFIFTKTQAYFCTVATGLEFIAEEEIAEKLHATAIKRKDRQGKVFFATDAPLQRILSLRSADNVYAFVAEINGIPSDANGLLALEKVPLDCDWEPAIALWKIALPLITNGDKTSSFQPEHIVPSLATTVPTEPIEVKFRVTGHRVGNQVYKSPEMAGSVGAGVIEKYGWKVDLKNFNMEVYADLNGDNLALGISLSPYTLYNRHRNHLGLTALKPSIAYCMARLARIQSGQTVFDPMMGVGTIPIETAEVWKDALVLGGDIKEECITKAVANVKDCGIHVDFVRWTVTGLPLRNGTIDVTLSDIPFGRRSGFHKQNRKLYPGLFRELTRVTKSGGKAVILTLEKGLMRGILADNPYWKLVNEHPCDNGGYSCSLYLMERTVVPMMAQK